MRKFKVWLYKNGEKFFQLEITAENRHYAEYEARMYGLPIGAIEEYSDDT